MLDLIILLVIAVFIFVKLFDSLGFHNKKQDQNKRGDSFLEQFKKNIEEGHKADIEIASALEASLSQEIRGVMDKIRKYESGFTAEKFVESANKAFLMILKAFADCDKATLNMLLAKDVYIAFEKEIESRLATKKKMITAVISSKVSIKNAYIEGEKVMIEVGISSEQISFIKDDLGNIISGSESVARTKVDIWKFSKILGKSDIWLLSSTSS
ncbi:Tim44 domain-containing protein [Candidatus Cyrtobacter comes]|uniref:Tim44 domain-containing protein n=1 Tax=Candidatus Cyrtobacter comes TaxID=675776 RepID=A0ABU5L7D1_9RICK|nr:Tim44/TimA family putative adaptor protein [Candidatus Cyrtobacter comes]MDZ5762036.1 Tim44 domain-containing protein [Candidatus Cyrtobacter comes]